MRLPRASAAVLLTILAGLPARASADELVQVAAHRAALPDETSTPPLFGYLARPEGPGPFPAVVVLHWCSGFGPHDVATAARLKSWGYVALALDSLGEANRCTGGPGGLQEGEDAYAGLHYLSLLKFVARDRIAVMGFSMGAVATLDVVETELLQRMHAGEFRAAVAYYPNCSGSSGVMRVPTLILIGQLDDWTPAAACRKKVDGESDIGVSRHKGQGAPVKLVIYSGATHAFDSPSAARHYLGHFMQYDPAAAKDAEGQVRAFLAQTLKAGLAPPH